MSGQNEKENDGKLSLSDVYGYLWRGRDFELEHLWQRSVFLGVFLIAIATGYAVYIKDIFLPALDCKACVEAQVKPQAQNNSCVYTFIIDNAALSAKGEDDGKESPYSRVKCRIVFGAIPLMLTYLGAVFSLLWILMGKGSKAWYEVYEDSIAKMSKYETAWKEAAAQLAGTENDPSDTDKAHKEYKALSQFLFGKLNKKNDTAYSDSIRSLAAGGFSVSKINIMIGIISLKVFIAVLTFHVYWFMHECCEAPPPRMAAAFIAEALVLLLSYLRIKKRVASSYLGQ